MSEAIQPGQTLKIDGDGKQPVVIHIHGDGAEINVNVTHYHYPDWLTKEMVDGLLKNREE